MLWQGSNMLRYRVRKWRRTNAAPGDGTFVETIRLLRRQCSAFSSPEFVPFEQSMPAIRDCARSPTAAPDTAFVAKKAIENCRRHPRPSPTVQGLLIAVLHAMKRTHIETTAFQLLVKHVVVFLCYPVDRTASKVGKCSGQQRQQV